MNINFPYYFGLRELNGKLSYYSGLKCVRKNDTCILQSDDLLHCFNFLNAK